ncbi:MAG: hypothetical protein EON90_04535 [Brevundimonas sp.]|nr:MAG: hypothetical protein EON90_04535 [Brevundimonas sp.]
MLEATHGPWSSRLKCILAAGVAAGLADMVYATVRSLMAAGSADTPWRAVASGWIGRSAQGGGPAPVILGLATHFGLAILMAAVWVLAVRGVAPAQRRRWVAATAYGLSLYAVMYCLVLPLRWPSAFPRWEGWGSVFDVLAHLGVGLIIAWVAGRPAVDNPPPHGART